MTIADRRRPFDLRAETQSPQPGDAFSHSLAPQAQTVCTLINRRPRDLPQFQAACAASEGRPVLELDAFAALPGMTVWHLGTFRTITSVKRDGATVSLWMLGDGPVPSRYLDGGLPLYRLGEGAVS